MTATPGSGAREQVARLLRLVPYLHGRGQVPLEEAATMLGVTAEQLDRDLRVLFMVGLPGGYPDDLIDVDLEALEGEGVIRVSNADYLARPLRLTPTEATAIIVALRALRAGAADETRGVVDRTLAKLEAAAGSAVWDQTVGPGAAHQVDPGQARPVTATLRAELEGAVAAGRQVRLSYYVPARDEESERVVDPRGVVTRHGAEYLDAWCHSAEAPRLFRLDRIHEATVLDSPIVTEPARPRDLSAGVFAHGDAATRVTLRLEPQARWVEEYYDVAEVRPADDGGSEVDLLVGDERWLERLLLRLTPHARVLAPPGYAGAADAARAATLALYGPPPG